MISLRRTTSMRSPNIGAETDAHPLGHKVLGSVRAFLWRHMTVWDYLYLFPVNSIKLSLESNK